MKLLARIIALAVFPFVWLARRCQGSRLLPAPSPQLVSVRFEMRVLPPVYTRFVDEHSFEQTALHATMLWDDGSSVTYRRAGIDWYDGPVKLAFMSPRRQLLDELRHCWREQIPHPLLMEQPEC